MATERDANQAREKHSDYLRKLGAHAISVDEVRRKGEATFAVIAWFEKKPAEVPKTLQVRRGKVKSEVPLVVKVAGKFQLE